MSRTICICILSCIMLLFKVVFKRRLNIFSKASSKKENLALILRSCRDSIPASLRNWRKLVWPLMLKIKRKALFCIFSSFLFAFFLVRIPYLGSKLNGRSYYWKLCNFLSWHVSTTQHSAKHSQPLSCVWYNLINMGDPLQVRLKLYAQVWVRVDYF